MLKVLGLEHAGKHARFLNQVRGDGLRLVAAEYKALVALEDKGSVLLLKRGLRREHVRRRTKLEFFVEGFP